MLAIVHSHLRELEVRDAKQAVTCGGGKQGGVSSNT